VENGSCEFNLTGQILSFEISPQNDKIYILTDLDKKIVHVYENCTRTEPLNFNSSLENINRIKIINSNELLIGFEYSIDLYDLEKKTTRPKPVVQSTFPILSLEFSENIIYAGHPNGLIQSWNKSDNYKKSDKEYELPCEEDVTQLSSVGRKTNQFLICTCSNGMAFYARDKKKVSLIAQSSNHRLIMSEAVTEQFVLLSTKYPIFVLKPRTMSESFMHDLEEFHVDFYLMKQIHDKSLIQYSINFYENDIRPALLNTGFLSFKSDSSDKNTILLRYVFFVNNSDASSKKSIKKIDSYCIMTNTADFRAPIKKVNVFLNSAIAPKSISVIWFGCANFKKF
jgi:hypothetical protein